MTTTAIPKPPAIPSPMFSVAEACEYLKVRKSFLYELIRTGDLRARKLGSRTVILRADLDDLIEKLPQRRNRDALGPKVSASSCHRTIPAQTK
ncbi:helix-turn-helix domain-containing protein [Bradyrhizobium sp. DASA03120]|uniref:helix-turn-helix domain-containing protein n=1 Tax=Bradyrhizobium sp. SMVTL-02 TaxID=3395917 RepID=UPI003F6FF151